MEYSSLVDFAKRTRDNLSFINQIYSNNQANPEVYEVTQLINSLLGLIVMPKEKYLKLIPNTKLEELEIQGWPKIKSSLDKPYQPSTLQELIEVMRHGIAHFNIEVQSEDKKITGIRISNKIKHIWEAEMNLDDLREFVNNFVDLFIKTLEANE